MLLRIAEARSQPDHLPDWLRHCVNEITRPGAAPDYDALARSCHMSRSTLGRKFREHMGIAPHAYAIQVRLAHACSLLRETDLPLKAIAAQLGYSDVYFFSKQFRKHIGVPPGAFRESRQG
jgi:iron complex transport system substrate-binding protein